MRNHLIDAIRTIIDTLTLEEHEALVKSLIGLTQPRAPGTLTADVIVSALADTGGNMTRAAVVLGVARKTLQNRMREFNIDVGRGGRPKL